MRVVMQRKLASDFTATWITARGRPGSGHPGRSCRTSRFALKRDGIRWRQGSGTLPGSKTSWIASYRWISGQGLTPVDSFNASPGQADPYLNVFIRQPIPGTGSCRLI